MKPEEVGDPKKRFSGVRQQSGSVRRDADWNTKRGPRRGVLMLGAGALVVVLAGVIAAGWLFLRGRSTPDMDRASFVNLSAPGDGAFVPVHGQQYVVAEAYAGSGVRELQLWVNDQQWGTIAPVPPRRQVTQTWGWRPSGEGEHHLVARLVADDGTVSESPLVRVYAAGAMDIRFPVSYETQLGDTAEGIAAQFGASQVDILETNPQLDPSGSLPAGLDLTIPVPFTDAVPSQTDFGEPAAPPAGGVLVPPGSSFVDVVDGVHQAQLGSGGVPLWKGFNLNDGILDPHEPVDLLYLYLSVDGKEWGRLPKNPTDYLHPQNGVFDLTSYLKQVANQAGGGPVQIHAEVWGWRQGVHTFLGSYFGELTTDGGGLQTTPTGGTQLRVVDYVYLGKEHYKQWAALAGDAPDLIESFRWTTTLPGVSYALWQVSDSGFPAGSTLNPPGLIHQGMTTGAGGTFDLNFAKYFVGYGGGGGGFGGLGSLGGIDIPTSLEDLIGGDQDPSKQFIPWLPKAFFVRVVPMKGQYFPGLPGVVAGPPSAPIFVAFNPKGGYSPKLAPSGPAFEAHVVGFQPYRPADPAYAACFVFNVDVVSCNQMTNPPSCSTPFPKGMLSCGCPGVSCSGSSSSCGDISLGGFSDCLQKGAGAFGDALGSLISIGTDLYNGAVDFITDALASVACGGLSGDAKKVCEAGVSVAVNVGLASLGLPPQIPDFDQLMNEGLDYALAYAAQELSAQLGFECDKYCQDLIKAGIEGVKNPEKLFNDGLSFAVERATAEIEELGGPWGCDAKCQSLIRNAAQGKLQVSMLSPGALQQAAASAAQELTANGYPCSSSCQQAILEGLQDSRELVVSAANAAAAKPPPPVLVPHDLAVEQPAILTVEIFRRYESGNVPQEDLDNCGLIILNDEATQIGTSAFQFSPFADESLPLPAMDPGETVTVPIVLDRTFTDITQAMIDAVTAEAEANAAPPANPQPGVVYGLAIDPWGDLYSGGLLEFHLSGTPFVTSAGGVQYLPCVADDSWSTGIPAP